MSTALFREALDACAQFGLEPHYMQVIAADAIVVICHHASDERRAFAGRRGFVAIVPNDDPDSAAHVRVAVGRVHFTTFLPAGDLKVGDSVVIPEMAQVAA